MIHDILLAIPWAFLLAISIGPGFFMLLETSITKGFKAAFTLDLGIVFSDIIFILIAYFATNQILSQLKDNPDDEEDIQKNNYLGLFFKGVFLNIINIGVLGFWMMIIITHGPKLEMNPLRIFVFFTSILVFYLLIDIYKILLAKQLKNKLTPNNIYKIKRIISIVILIFGVFFILQGLFPKSKQIVNKKLGIEQVVK
jgi:threonine/homoserine/homoserine lactone efflux protein